MRCAGVILVSSVSGSPAVPSHTYNLRDSIEASAKRDVYNDYQFICGVGSTCVDSSPCDGSFGSDLDCVGSTRICGVSVSTVGIVCVAFTQWLPAQLVRSPMIVRTQ